VDHWRRPFWERVDTNERETFLFTEEETEYNGFKAASLNPYHGPQIKACVWRTTFSDHFLLKVAHLATDAGGLKDIAQLISRIYSRLASEPDYRPTPNIKTSRGLWQVLRHIPLHAYPRIYFDCFKEARSLMGLGATHTLLLEEGPHTPLIFTQRHVTADQLKSLVTYGRVHDATLNDLMMTAFFRALALEGNWDGKSQLSLVTTVDFRKWYFPTGRVSAVANLSGGAYPTLGTELGEDFSSTLRKVTAVTQRQKTLGIGLHGYLFWLPTYMFLPNALVKSMVRSGYKRQAKSHNMTPCLTNLGDIDPEDLVMEGLPLRAWILPPPGYAPLFVAGFSGFAGTVTLSAGAYSYQKATVERFFDRVLFELSL
jgi:NRPS condensation-like uncharacterized protein